MDAVLSAKLENAQQSLIETCELFAMYNPSELKDVVELSSNLMKDILDIKNNAIKAEQSIEVAKQENSVKDFEAAYKKALETSSKKIQHARTNEYKAFQNRLNQITNVSNAEEESGCADQPHGNMDDELIMETQVNVYDPITKRRMINPVRNTICGHHYEKDTILEAIDINKKLRCPVAGCGNKKFVKKEHLMADLTFKMQLKRLTETQSQELEV